MKIIKQFLIILILLTISHSAAQEQKLFGRGVLLFGAFDVDKADADEGMKKEYDIVKLERTEDSYHIYFSKGNVTYKNTYKKTRGVGEEGRYFDSDGYIYYIKDLLDSRVKALDIISTMQLESHANKLKMFRVLIE